MERIIEAFAKLSFEKRLLIMVGALALVIGGDYLFVLRGQQEELARTVEEHQKLQAELLDKQQKAKDLSNYKREVERLRQRLREAEEQLPKKKEIDKLLKDISYEAQQSGLSISRFEVQKEEPKGTFAAVPVRMEVEGNYHEIAVFLDRLAKLPRIINVTELQMNKPREVNKKVVVTASYVATTYRFIERKGSKS